MAMLLQNMSAKLGIVTQLDLAQSIRLHTDKFLSVILWLIAELAIMATDVAEVIGAAIALNLLFKIPLIVATLITILDVLFLLFLSKIGFRKIEILVSCLIFVILFIFAYEVILSRPNWINIGVGLLPSSKMLAKAPIIGGIPPLSGSLGIIVQRLCLIISIFILVFARLEKLTHVIQKKFAKRLNILRLIQIFN